MAPRRILEQDELDRLAEQSARLALKKTFAILGVDIDDPREVEEFRQDLRFAGAMRQYTNKGMLAMVTAVAVAIVAAVWAGLQIKVGGK